uniref:MHD domain-containing protein n=1 Tax=Ciona savignyi TaxID=51511 RepID=H2YU53_CIOSA
PKVIFISMQGEKNNGFDILYHNMKHGVISVKSLQDLFRESATTEDLYAKHLTKLAKQAANSSPLGTFAPMFEVVRVMSEKLSSCHMDIVHKLHEIIKDLAKYLEEQKNKHKQVNQLESCMMCMLLNGIHSRQGMINQVLLTERLRPLSMHFARVEHSGSKLIPNRFLFLRHRRYSIISSNYSQTFFVQRFQEIEEAHLRHMKSVLDNYILSFENANVLVNQVHQEFRRQVDENTIASLIKQYSESKGTGFEKPGPLLFEEWDPATLVSVETTPTKSRIPNLPFRRKRQRKNKEMVNGGSTTSKDTGTDKDNIDEDGYTIVPDAMKNAKNSWTMDSGDSSDSDSDDYISRKIHVKIKPKEQSRYPECSNKESNTQFTNSIDLSKLVKGRRSERATRGKNIRSPPTRTFSQSDKLGVGNSPLTLSPSPETPSSISPNPLTPSSPTSSNSPFTPKSMSPEKPVKSNPATFTHPGAVKVLPNPPSPKNSDLKSEEDPPHPVPAPRRTSIKQSAPSPANRFSTAFVAFHPPKLAKQTPYVKPRLHPTPQPQLRRKTTSPLHRYHSHLLTSSHSAPLASSESWSSLSSVGGTPMDSFASSRGPSPLTLMHGDPIPIAVAFTETAPYKRQFKPPTPLWCMVKITGDMQMSFPAGIVRAFTSNPNPAALSFKVKGVSNIKDFAPNASLIMADSSQTEVDSRSFFFNMSALVSHVKKMTDSNPNSPYYNIPVMSYQLSSAAGYDMVPLHISSTWVCDMQSTDICIDYKYVFLAVALHTPVKNIQVIVPVDGGVTNHQSVPQATWVSSQNRLSWKLPTPISSSSSPGSLKSTLSLSSGPSKPTTLAVQFVSEGVTLTGADFELTGTGYRISLIKRRFVSGLLGFLT